MAERSNGWGGKRPNTGRRRGTKARVYLRLSDEDAKSLWQLTKHRRLTQPDVTEETIVGELVNREWREIDADYQQGAQEAHEPFSV